MKIDALWGSRFGKRPAEGLLAFTAGRDMQHTQPYDERLIPYDLWGSKAHAIMLWKQKVISKKFRYHHLSRSQHSVYFVYYLEHKKSNPDNHYYLNHM